MRVAVLVAFAAAAAANATPFRAEVPRRLPKLSDGPRSGYLLGTSESRHIRWSRFSRILPYQILEQTSRDFEKGNAEITAFKGSFRKLQNRQFAKAVLKTSSKKSVSR